MVPPILNPYTRLAVEMCPAAGVVRAVGYETPTGGDLPQAVTSTCDLQAAYCGYDGCHCEFPFSKIHAVTRARSWLIFSVIPAMGLRSCQGQGLVAFVSDDGMLTSS